MSKPWSINLSAEVSIPILYEDRAVMAVDKPPGWMLAPESWQRTSRNLQAALVSSIRTGEFWARPRNLKYLRFVHRLDAETSGVLLLAKSPGAVSAYTRLFENRQVRKTYLAVVTGNPSKERWISQDRIGPEPGETGRMRVDPRNGKDAETEFRVLQRSGSLALLEARPRTGRTHQIRVHLSARKLPVAGDGMYGSVTAVPAFGLRAVALGYEDPFTRKRVRIHASFEEFVRTWGFDPSGFALETR
jgi:RluA family pseudouridine synthase